MDKCENPYVRVRFRTELMVFFQQIHSMPHFFFHARYEEHLVVDTKGLVLSDLDTAVQEVRERTRWLQQDKYRYDINSNFWFEINDDKGNLLVKMAFNESL